MNAQLQKWGGREKWIPGAQWPASLDHIERSRPERDLVTKMEREDAQCSERQHLRLSSSLHMHVHMCTYTHTYMNTHIYTP